MHLYKVILTYILFTVFISITLFSGCKAPQLNSNWREFEVIIDGQDIEWRGISNYFEKKSNILIGFLNDEENLYIRFSTMDRKLHRQIVSLGFTVWFDPKGGKKKRFGIHFPIGIKNMDLPAFRREHEINPEEQKKMFEKTLIELEILKPGKKMINRMPVTTAQMLGINVKIGYSTGNLVYEMKVPLNQSEKYLYAIEPENKGKIGIGFETDKINIEDLNKMRSERRGQTEDRRGTGGIGLNGMGRGGIGRGGMRRGRMGGMQIPESLEFWAKVTLATGF